MEIKSEKDLQELISNKISESTTLEYKSLDALENNFKIAKQISAMANAEGGIIIYGIKEDENRNPKEIEWTSNKELKDKIDQVLSTKINRKVEGIEIEEISSDENNEKFVIVVKVPRSDLSPHQLSESAEVKKYYRRSNSRIREMEQGEIEDSFFKRKRPKLELELKRCPTKAPSYDIIIHNKGKVLAEKIFIKLLVPGVFKISDQIWPKISDRFTHKGYSCSEYHYIGDEYIYPELPNTMGKLFHSKGGYVEFLEIGFLIVCKDMEIKRGKIILGDEETTKIIYTKEQGTPFPDWSIKEEFYALAEYYQ